VLAGHSTASDAAAHVSGADDARCGGAAIAAARADLRLRLSQKPVHQAHRIRCPGQLSDEQQV
jgi:hypothetical protein